MDMNKYPLYLVMCCTFLFSEKGYSANKNETTTQVSPIDSQQVFDLGETTKQIVEPPKENSLPNKTDIEVPKKSEDIDQLFLPSNLKSQEKQLEQPIKMQQNESLSIPDDSCGAGISLQCRCNPFYFFTVNCTYVPVYSFQKQFRYVEEKYYETLSRDFIHNYTVIKSRMVPHYYKEVICQYNNHYNTENKLYECIPEFYEQEKCDYIPEYYEEICSVILPEYYEEERSRYVPQCYYKQQCDYQPQYTYQQECRYVPEYYYKPDGK